MIWIREIKAPSNNVNVAQRLIKFGTTFYLHKNSSVNFCLKIDVLIIFFKDLEF